MRTAVIAITATALVALVACDKDTPATAQNTPPANASHTPRASSTQAVPTTAPAASGARSYECERLLSDAEALAATGVDFKLSEPKDGGAADPLGGFTDCGYFAPDGSYLQASVWTGPSYERGFLPQVQAARAGAAEPVGGLGDEAGWASQSTTLGVRVGGTGVTIAFDLEVGKGPADPKAAAVNLARVVIGRL